MHIPDYMLEGRICPVTATISTCAIIASVIIGMRAKQKPTAGQFSAITALIFALQMLNFPIMNGTSGHLVGGVLASSLLGIPFGILSLACVITVQCLVFSDGGLSVLGVNVLNMAVICAGAGGWLHLKIAKKWTSTLALALASWCSVVLAAFAVSVELAVSGQIAFEKVAFAMVGVHALTGIGEALLTVLTCSIYSSKTCTKEQNGWIFFPFLSAILIALFLSPFASSFPGGLEWVAEKYQFLHEAAPAFVGPLHQYAMASIDHAVLSTSIAGAIGVCITFIASLLFVKLCSHGKKFLRIYSNHEKNIAN